MSTFILMSTFVAKSYHGELDGAVLAALEMHEGMERPAKVTVLDLEKPIGAPDDAWVEDGVIFVPNSY